MPRVGNARVGQTRVGSTSIAESAVATASVTFGISESVTIVIDEQASLSSSATPTVSDTITAELRGTVTLSGTGVQGATVYVIDDINGELDAELTTDSNGEYSTIVREGTYHVTVQYENDTGEKFRTNSKPFIAV